MKALLGRYCKKFVLECQAKIINVYFRSSTPKSANRPQINLEEPFHPQQGVAISTEGSSIDNNIYGRVINNNAPVAAEPPHVLSSDGTGGGTGLQQHQRVQVRIK